MKYLFAVLLLVSCHQNAPVITMHASPAVHYKLMFHPNDRTRIILDEKDSVIVQGDTMEGLRYMARAFFTEMENCRKLDSACNATRIPNSSNVK